MKRTLLIIFRVFFTLGTAYVIYFIFSNSLENASESSLRSSEVARIINNFLAQYDLYLSEHTVRKLAHFSEFALLGFMLTMCLRVYTQHFIKHVSFPLLLTLLIANCDETIQIYVSGRSSSIIDVWIDFGGGCVGTMVALILLICLSVFLSILGFGRKHTKKANKYGI